MHKMNKVYFCGYFLRNHPLSMHTISCSIKYWSNVSFKLLIILFYNYNVKQNFSS